MVLSFSLSSTSWASSCANKYEDEIRLSVKRWWPDYNRPAAWAAQLCAESQFKPHAVSPVGARGLAQFMPLTWKQVAKELSLPAMASPHDAKYAIDAGAYYQGTMRRLRFWREAKTAEERNKFGQASYNAGAGNILKAARLCNPHDFTWENVKICLENVTGRHHKETIGYVDRIERYTRAIEARGFK